MPFCQGAASKAEGFFMRVLRDGLEQAQRDGVAVGHFNVSDLVLLKAVFAAARVLNVPVMVGVSEGEREFLGVRQIFPGTEFAGGVRFPDLSQRRPHTLPGEGC
jgi:hypothetical protein